MARQTQIRRFEVDDSLSNVINLLRLVHKMKLVLGILYPDHKNLALGTLV